MFFLYLFDSFCSFTVYFNSISGIYLQKETIFFLNFLSFDPQDYQSHSFTTITKYLEVYNIILHQ